MFRTRRTRQQIAGTIALMSLTALLSAGLTPVPVDALDRSIEYAAATINCETLGFCAAKDAER